MEVNRERLAASFTELCEIDSPSRREGRISRRLQELFRELGAAEIIEDDSARETGAECGNLVVRFDGASVRPTGSNGFGTASMPAERQ